jgi:hypothetical protein
MSWAWSLSAPMRAAMGRALLTVHAAGRPVSQKHLPPRRASPPRAAPTPCPTVKIPPAVPLLGGLTAIRQTARCAGIWASLWPRQRSSRLLRLLDPRASCRSTSLFSLRPRLRRVFGPAGLRRRPKPTRIRRWRAEIGPGRRIFQRALASPGQKARPSFLPRARSVAAWAGACRGITCRGYARPLPGDRWIASFRHAAQRPKRPETHAG